MSDPGATGVVATPACGNCAYWFDVPTLNMGECHAHAPSPGQGLAGRPGVNNWPITSTFDWCGEYSGVSSPPIIATPPAISGSLVHGNTLTCTQGTWQNAPASYAYQWSNGAQIAGATNSTYVTTTTDRQKMMTCAVTATNPSGSSTATSNALGPIT